jgi:hypothetical protein
MLPVPRWPSAVQAYQRGGRSWRGEDLQSGRTIGGVTVENPFG